MGSRNPSVILSSRVELWYSFLEGAVDAGSLEGCRCCLTPMELAQAQEFALETDRTLYVAARIMARSLLSRYTGCPPCELVFHHNAYGKPYLAKPIQPPLRFSISHTRGLVACAVALGQEVGVDAEAMDRTVFDVLGLARLFFASGEVSTLERLPGREQDRGFFRFWTLKEAYIKGRGMGLSVPLQSFSFSVGDGPSPCISFSGDAGDDAGDWRFAAFQLGRAHRVALAVCCPSASPLAARVQEIRPGDWLATSLSRCRSCPIDPLSRYGREAGKDATGVAPSNSGSSADGVYPLHDLAVTPGLNVVQAPFQDEYHEVAG